jgi:translation initiation factor IF-2
VKHRHPESKPHGERILAVRIYALAKELQLDSKDLVDICTRIGIPGKGSALASLTEAEVEKVKQHLSGGTKTAKPKAASGPAPMERPRPAGPSGDRLKVIVTPKTASPLEAVKAARQAKAAEAEAAEYEAQYEGEPVAETPANEEASAASTDSSPPSTPESAAPESAAPRPTPPSEPSGPLAGMLRREDYIGPGGAMAGKPRVMGQPAKPKPKTAQGGSGNRARPAIKFAPIPAPSEANRPRPRVDEAPAQKPDMRLPAEILGGKAGDKPLAAHLRRAERTLEAEKARKAGTPTPTTDTDDSKGRGRGAKGRGAKPGEEDRTMLGGREQRQASRRRSPRSDDDDTGRGGRRSIRRTARRSGASTAAPRKERVTL